MEDSKYLVFIKKQLFGRKTPTYTIKNKSGEYLGLITFNPAWRKFVFNPAPDTIFDAACLSDIIIKLNDATAEWRPGLKEKQD